MNTAETAVTEKTAVAKNSEQVFLPALRAILSSLPPRSQDILEARFGIGHHKQKTLEEIGQEYSITRERVRQIICNALHVLVKHHEREDVGASIERMIHKELARHSGVMRFDDLLLALAHDDKEERGALMAFLECLPYARSEKAVHGHEKICFLNSFSHDEWQKTQKVASEVLEKRGKALSTEKLFVAVKKDPALSGLTEKQFVDYLSVSKEIRQNVFEKWGLVHWSDIAPKGTREQAYLVLKHHKKPMHFRDIAKAIDTVGLRKRGKSHPQTVHNELIKDARFVLIGRGIYALAEWGYFRGTVKDVIAHILTEAGKPLSRDEVLEAVLAVRQVKRTTVSINLNNSFKKTAEGLYTV